MATGYASPTLVNRREVDSEPMCDREMTLIEKLDFEEKNLKTRLADIEKLRNLLVQNPDVHEILKLMGRRY